MDGDSLNTALTLTPRSSGSRLSDLTGNPILKNIVDIESNGSQRCSAIIIVNDFTSETLLCLLNKEWLVRLFLKIMGIIWPEANDNLIDKIIQYSWSVTVRAFLVIIICATSFYFLNDFIGGGIENKVVNLLVAITLFLQSAVLIPAIFTIHARLNKPCLKAEIPHYLSSLPRCLLVFTLSVLTGGFFPVFLVRGTFPPGRKRQHYYAPNAHLDLTNSLLDAGAFIGEVAISCMLAVNMLFISVDASLCASLVDLLIKQQHDKQITLESFDLIRSEVITRVAAAKSQTNIIVLVALLDVLVVVILLLFLTTNLTPSTGGYLAAMCTLFLKEIPFLLIVFLQSAKVNEKSDKLIKLLGTSQWVPSEETTRMALYINAEADPISYPLAGMRLSVNEVYARFAVWTGTVLVGIMRSVISV